MFYFILLLIFGIVKDKSPPENSKIVGRSHVYVQKFLIDTPTKFDPATLPILPAIIDIETAIAL